MVNVVNGSVFTKSDIKWGIELEFNLLFYILLYSERITRQIFHIGWEYVIFDLKLVDEEECFHIFGLLIIISLIYAMFLDFQIPWKH